MALTAPAWLWMLAPAERWDSSTKTSMVIYLRSDIPNAEIGRFQNAVLSVPTDRGFTLPNGVVGTNTCTSPPGTVGVCVLFAPGASRKELRTKAEAWPTVIAVLEDVAPADVTRQDLGLPPLPPPSPAGPKS